MATGNYGTVRPADVSPSDVEMWYQYTPNRDQVGGELQPLDPNQYLVKVDHPEQTGEIFGGLYTLKLPASDFGNKGIYTIIIRPKQIRTTISSCGVLSSKPDVTGVIFSLNDVDVSDRQRFNNGSLVGYRIEYLKTETSDEKKLQNFFRVITSNNFAEAVNENVSSTSQKAERWRFNDNSNLVFCTLTPSSAPAVKPNAIPFLGQPGQEVIITNTFFNPIMLEVEMVEHDHETLAYALYGPQTKSLDDGIYTIYNFGEQIYRQYNLYEVKDRFTGKPLYEVREERDGIDRTKEFDNITDF
jgi:hypothetical protein